MTTEGYDEIEIVATPASELEIPPELIAPSEAGFSINFTMLDGDGVSTQVTMRGAMVTDWPEVMKERRAFIQRALKSGWTTRATTAPAKRELPDTPAAERAADLGQAAPAAPKPTSPAPMNGNGATSKAIQEFIAIKVEIEPRDGGKANLKFYEAGHKYPDLQSVKPAANWSGMLNWSIDEFNHPRTFDGLALKVRYTLSDKLNSKGNPYKDLVDVKPA